MFESYRVEPRQSRWQSRRFPCEGCGSTDRPVTYWEWFDQASHLIPDRVFSYCDDCLFTLLATGKGIHNQVTEVAS